MFQNASHLHANFKTIMMNQCYTVDLGKATYLISMEIFWVDSETSHVGVESNAQACCCMPAIEHFVGSCVLKATPIPLIGTQSIRGRNVACLPVDFR